MTTVVLRIELPRDATTGQAIGMVHKIANDVGGKATFSGHKPDEPISFNINAYAFGKNTQEVASEPA